jgi:hypothetical protein
MVLCPLGVAVNGKKCKIMSEAEILGVPREHAVIWQWSNP